MSGGGAIGRHPDSKCRPHLLSPVQGHVVSALGLAQKPTMSVFCCKSVGIFSNKAPPSMKLLIRCQITRTEIQWTPMHGHAWSTHASGPSVGKVWIQKSFSMDGPSMDHGGEKLTCLKNSNCAESLVDFL